jgi:CO/xanthine dehydrogenase Mo-binding subunit
MDWFTINGDGVRNAFSHSEHFFNYSYACTARKRNTWLFNFTGFQIRLKVYIIYNKETLPPSENRRKRNEGSEKMQGTTSSAPKTSCGFNGKQSICKPVTKIDHAEKTSGRAVYIADMQLEEMLCADVLRSSKAHARIDKITLPPLEEGYTVIDYRDIPGINQLKVVTSEQPIFAEDTVTYIGQPILMIAGPDEDEINKILAKIKVDYTELDAVLTIDQAKEAVNEYNYGRGDVEAAFRSAAEIVTETFESGYQEQAYIETNGAIANWDGDVITVYGSIQCPYYVHGAVAQAFGLPDEKVRIIQATTGGGFGGKEDYPSLIGCHVALASYKTGKPVRMIHKRREDMAATTKRHPSKIKISASLDSRGEITGIKVDTALDAGAYDGVSTVVLQRSIICACGVYNIPNVFVHGRAVVTNTVPTGAFRGFGAPQSFFAIETFMSHLAKKFNMEPLEFKRKYLVKQFDATPTGGQFHDPVLLDEMIRKAEELSGYSEKRRRYQNQTGRCRRGIGISLFLHGCGFTGSVERDYIKSVVHLQKREDDKVEILVSTAEMGQGVRTTFCKIVSEVLGIPLDRVIYENPDTSRVPNSGPTVASRSIMVVGRLLEKAALRLKKEWKAGERQLIEERYLHPELIPWDLEKFSGDAYATFAWGVNVVELELDTLLATTRILGAWGVFDVGTPIDQRVMQGQIEGGMLQGIGYASMEKMERQGGRILQSSLTDYIIPTAMDTVNFETFMIDNPYHNGPFGAKGAGELTLVGAAPAYVAAVENAAGEEFRQIPLTPEKIMEVIA